MSGPIYFFPCPGSASAFSKQWWWHQGWHVQHSDADSAFITESQTSIHSGSLAASWRQNMAELSIWILVNRLAVCRMASFFPYKRQPTAEQTSSSRRMIFWSIRDWFATLLTTRFAGSNQPTSDAERPYSTTSTQSWTQQVTCFRWVAGHTEAQKSSGHVRYQDHCPKRDRKTIQSKSS